ncbi:MAG: efflux RND transporter periplasmic adaptor subunit [Bacillota bacterium]
MRRSVKWVIWGIFLLGLVAYAVAGAVRPLKVETVVAEPQTIAKTFTEEGLVVPVLEQVIYSAAGGKVAKLAVAEGEQVESGKLLVEMDTREIGYQLDSLRGQLSSIEGQQKQAFRPPLEAQLAQQRLAIEQAMVQLAAARAEFERLNVLYQGGALSKGDYEAAEKTVRQMEFLVSQQEKALELMQEQGSPPSGTKEHFYGLIKSLEAQIALLEYRQAQGKTFAPMDGIVREIHVQEGAVIAPGMPLVTLFKPDEMQIEVFLLPEDVLSIKPGMEVKLLQENPGGKKIYPGAVIKMAPGATEKLSPLGLVEQRVKVTIKLNGDLKEIRPGYNLEAEFITYREEGKLVVPKTVLFPYKGGEALWLVREGKASIQPVKKGFATNEQVVIEDGLKPGDRVIRNPRLEGLKPGQKVEFH